MLPGLDGTGLLFRPLQKALPPDIHCKVIAYPPDEQLHLSELAALVARQLPDTKAVLLAESFSGLVALKLLASARDRLRGLILVGAFAEPPRPLLLRLSPLVSCAGRLMQSAPAFLIRQYCLGTAATDADIQGLRGSLSAVAPAVLAQRLRLIGTRESFGQDGFGIPCIYIQASEDRLVPATSAQWFQKRFKHLSIETIEGPHFLLQARPAQSARVIERALRFLSQG